MQAPSCPGKLAARFGGAALAASLLAAAAGFAGPAASAATTGQQRFVPGAARAVFVQTDNLAGNQVVAYRRAAGGTLTLAGTYATGGGGGRGGRGGGET